MSQLLISMMSAIVVTAIALKLLKPIAPHVGLIDEINHRKRHTGDIPLIGGIAMYLGVFFSVIVSLPSFNLVLPWLLTSAGIVVLGVVDDAKDLSVRFRLLVQAILTLIITFSSGYYLMDMGNLFGFGNINLGQLGYLITIFAVIGAINAFNMMDGIDGLAGAMALVSFSALAVLFSVNGDHYGLYISLLMSAVLLPYLANNLLLPPYKHKIFLGDAGAMLIGFSVVWLLIYGSQSPTEVVSLRPVTALWLIAVPLLDMAAIMVRRLNRGQSPFMADRDHLHHLFMDAGLSPKETLYLMSVIGFSMAVVGVLGEVLKVPDIYLLIGFFIVLGIYQKFIRVLVRKSKKQSVITPSKL